MFRIFKIQVEIAFIKKPREMKQDKVDMKNSELGFNGYKVSVVQDA